MDLVLIISQVAYCNSWLGAKCSSKIASPVNLASRGSFSPFFRLLDLDNDCLVELTNPEAYMALSYIWGKADVFKTVNSIIEEMKMPDSHMRNLNKFPKSIADIIMLATALGYRYLRIDSLCIIQNNGEDESSKYRR
jgi:hypothetical protein